jgi:hypothetical protein
MNQEVLKDNIKGKADCWVKYLWTKKQAEEDLMIDLKANP